MSTPTNPVINVTVKCKSRTEYDTPVPSESCRLQIGEDNGNFIDVGLRGNLSNKISRGKSYQFTITEIVG